MDQRRRFVHVLLILFFLLVPLSAGRAAPEVQEDVNYQERARQLLDTLTPEEKVGQLFLLAFDGPEAGSRTQIYDLIYNHHVGGVVLRADRDNFLAPDQTLPIALSLTHQIQTIKYTSSNNLHEDPVSGEQFRPAFIPMFVAISQEGDGSPYDQILNGMSALPSQMAIGATWNPEAARQVGLVLGQELSYLGINMLLGPSLDVLESPHGEGTSDLGVRSFGGDPYWVGEMGKAYIAGVHEGARGEMAVVAKHFPGFGSSDRLPEEDVATVRKSLEQLKQIELAPFFSVTGDAPNQASTVDGLLTSHIRYQGFHENLRATTKPVTLDPQAFGQLLNLPAFSAWRQNSGIMVSDDLGGQAMRKFYETTGQAFTGRFVARDAFLAGNDLLYIGDFASSDDPDSYQSIMRTLDLFSQKYREDDAFADRVDQSVLRILTLKYKMYGGNFSLTASRGPQSVPSTMGSASQLAFNVIRDGATLISPPNTDLVNTLPDPPGRNDYIIFITDVRTARQCSNCPLQNVVNPNALATIVTRLYSPAAGGQILPNHLISYTFQDLLDMLAAGTGVMQIENDIKQANWIVFSMLNVDSDIPSSTALKQFLAQRPDLIQNKHTIVFALNSPYYLDSTEISRLSAYYALYSKTPRALDVAARLLFQEIQANGSLPVSVPGVGYDLRDATFPDPEQVIPLQIDSGEPPDPSVTPSPQALPEYRVGNTIPVRTGVILDHNGHQVPDNTVVRILVSRGEGSAPVTYEAQTVGGIARASIRVDAAGVLEIRAESDPAKNSQILSFNILTEEGLAPPPTQTPEPTATPTPEPTPTPTLTPEPTEAAVPPDTSTHLGDWALSMFVSVSACVAAYFAAGTLGHFRWGVRGGLLALLGGMLAYLYIAIGMPGSEEVVVKSGTMGVVGITFLGALAGWLAAVAWRLVDGFNGKTTDSKKVLRS